MSVKRSALLASAAFYLLIAFEFFYMASPFAAYLYGVYGPGLRFASSHPSLAWLGRVFLPHLAVDTRSLLLDARESVGGVLFGVGLLGFAAGAAQVYYHKLARKGVVLGGVYDYVRHPQYAALAVSGLGMLLLWPRYVVLVAYVGMLFVYRGLAGLEEKECEERFGEAYRQYSRSTHRFVPFSLPFALPPVPRSRLAGAASWLAVFAAAMALSVGAAHLLSRWSVGQLYALFDPDAAYVCLTKVDDDELRGMRDAALASDQVQEVLSSAGVGAGTRLVVYVLPAHWYVAEIPMMPVPGSERGHYTPGPGDAPQYKMVFAQARFAGGAQPSGRDILLRADGITPLIEVWVDRERGQVSRLRRAPPSWYDAGIPLPLY